MYALNKTPHSYIAWLVLAILMIVVISSAIAYINKKSLSPSEKKLVLLGLIFSHTQLILGLVLYFTSPFGFGNLSRATMKDSAARLLAVEHPSINILAIILITIGYSKAKKLANNPDGSKTIMIYYGLGLLLILSRIPWSVWLG